MSGEFRWVSGGAYLHSVLVNIAVDSEPGTHEVSRALHKLYAACAPIERACAWVEACDSSPPHIRIELMRHGHDLKAACHEVLRLIHENDQLIDALLREQAKP
jgi:hypothetical protein